MQPPSQRYAISDAPGHFVEWNAPRNRYDIQWRFLSKIYSPPFLLPHIIKCELSLRDNPEWKVALPFIIGSQGKHFIRITGSSKCHYIFYHTDNDAIEIWGYRANAQRAYHALLKHINYITTRRSKNISL